MMTDDVPLTLNGRPHLDELLRWARTAVAQAQEESRRLGVPNVYCINGRIYFETPTGELSLTDPYQPEPAPRVTIGDGRQGD